MKPGTNVELDDMLAKVWRCSERFEIKLLRIDLKILVLEENTK